MGDGDSDGSRSKVGPAAEKTAWISGPTGSRLRENPLLVGVCVPAPPALGPAARYLKLLIRGMRFQSGQGLKYDTRMLM